MTVMEECDFHEYQFPLENHSLPHLMLQWISPQLVAKPRMKKGESKMTKSYSKWLWPVAKPKLRRRLWEMTKIEPKWTSGGKFLHLLNWSSTPLKQRIQKDTIPTLCVTKLFFCLNLSTELLGEGFPWRTCWLLCEAEQFEPYIAMVWTSSTVGFTEYSFHAVVWLAILTKESDRD